MPFRLRAFATPGSGITPCMCVNETVRGEASSAALAVCAARQHQVLRRAGAGAQQAPWRGSSRYAYAGRGAAASLAPPPPPLPLRVRVAASRRALPPCRGCMFLPMPPRHVSPYTTQRLVPQPYFAAPFADREGSQQLCLHEDLRSYCRKNKALDAAQKNTTACHTRGTHSGKAHLPSMV